VIEDSLNRAFVAIAPSLVLKLVPLIDVKVLTLWTGIGTQRIGEKNFCSLAIVGLG
jgi:hypothetical protein